MRWLILSCCLALFACGSKPAADKPNSNGSQTGAGTSGVCGADALTEEQRALVDRAVALFVDLGKVVMAAKSDCDAMAKGIDEWLVDNDAERREVMKKLARLPREPRVECYNEKLSEELAVREAMEAGLSGCKDHEGIQAAFDRME